MGSVMILIIIAGVFLGIVYISILAFQKGLELLAGGIVALNSYLQRKFNKPDQSY